jgi:hypothetical protein
MPRSLRTNCAEARLHRGALLCAHGGWTLGGNLRRGRSLSAVIVMTLAAWACVGCGVAAAAEPFWSGAIPIDPGKRLSAVSCVRSSACVAVDAAGDVLTTSDPSGSGGEWTRVHVEGAQPPEEFPTQKVSCASESLCLLIGGPVGGVFASRNPLSGSPEWVPEHIDPEGGLTDVSCVMPSLCVASGEHGEILTSTEPTSSGSWILHHLSASGRIAAVSCGPPSLCVAVEALRGIFVTTNPGSGEWQNVALPWSPPPQPSELQPFGVSCVEGPLCVVSGESEIFATTNPTGGASAWIPVGSDGGGGGVSCDPAPRCVAFSGSSNSGLITSGAPTTVGSWVGHFAGFRFMSGVACIEASWCVAIDPSGDEFVSTEAHVLRLSVAGSATGWVTSTTILCPFLSCSRETPGLIEPLSPVEVACGKSFTPSERQWGTCELPYPSSNRPTLTATSTGGFVFAGWGGACTGTSPTCTLSLSEDREVTATFGAPGPNPPVKSAPKITRLRESSQAFAVGRKQTPLTAATARRPHRGTTFSFTLDQAASVSIKIERIIPGTRVGRRCRAARRPRHRAHRCTLGTRLTVLTRTAHAGVNRVAFSGRIGARRLSPGRYQAAFTAANAVGRSPVRRLSFTVLAG